jgi:hypothetical protein
MFLMWEEMLRLTERERERFCDIVILFLKNVKAHLTKIIGVGENKNQNATKSIVK